MRIEIITLILCSFSTVFAQTDSVITFNNGNSKYSGQTINGKKTGQWVGYDISGNEIFQIEIKTTYLSEVTRYNNDSSEYEIYSAIWNEDTLLRNGSYLYVNNNRNSRTEARFRNGAKIDQERLYVFNRLSSVRIYWTTTSNTQNIVFRNDGSIASISWKMSSSDTLDGLSMNYDKLGNIESMGEMSKDCKIGEWSYYINGKLSSRGTHYNDYIRLIDLYDNNIFYFVNKEGLRADSLYSEEVINKFDYNRQYFYLKDGEWNYYGENGELVKMELYRAGELISVEIFE